MPAIVERRRPVEVASAVRLWRVKCLVQRGDRFEYVEHGGPISEESARMIAERLNLHRAERDAKLAWYVEPVSL